VWRCGVAGVEQSFCAGRSNSVAAARVVRVALVDRRGKGVRRVWLKGAGPRISGVTGERSGEARDGDDKRAMAVSDECERERPERGAAGKRGRVAAAHGERGVQLAASWLLGTG